MLREAGCSVRKRTKHVMVSHGYRYIFCRYSDDPRLLGMCGASGYIPEHRLVVARRLGRPLTEDETVHHINGDTLDNKYKNLQLRRGKHGKHACFRCADCGSSNVVSVPIDDPAPA